MKRILERTLRLIALIIAVVMIATSAIPLDVHAQTNESDTQTAVIAANKATPGDTSGVKKKADGLYKKNGYYYYYKNNKVLKRTGWVKIDKSNYIKLDSGSGLTDHGWTELWDSSSKSWKLYDSCLQRAIYYNLNIADYFPGESPVDKTAQLTVSNGRVTWKWVK